MQERPEAAEIERTLREHIRAKYSAGVSEEHFDSNEDLLASGMIDSMGVLEVISFVEQTFGVTVADEEIVPKHFRSVWAMTELVAAKKDIQVADPYAETFRAFVEESVPEGATVLVVSRGYDALLQLDGIEGRHFLRDAAGGYGGSPADGSDAVTQLETQRALGATYLAFPGGELWWLDHYEGLRDRLESSGEVARSQAGVIYSLVPSRS